MPSTPEDYVHRIGRTARAGASGIAISFCEPSERLKLFRIEKLIDLKLEVTKSNLLNPDNIIGYHEEIRTPSSKVKNYNDQFEDKKYKSKKLATTKGKSNFKRTAKKNKLLQNKKTNKK